MSELPAQDIRTYAKTKGMIVPFSERSLAHGKTYGLGPSSYDFRSAQHVVLMPYRKYWLWRIYKLIDKVLKYFGQPAKFEDYHCGFVLISTIERVAIPDNLSAQPLDKSTWVRHGIVVQNTHFDPGFIGYPTIELTNHSHDTVTIPKGVAICQFKFTRLSAPTEMPYKGKYQNQPDRPVTAKEGTDVWA